MLRIGVPLGCVFVRTQVVAKANVLAPLRTLVLDQLNVEALTGAALPEVTAALGSATVFVAERSELIG
jgi:hypothetical protein